MSAYAIVIDQCFIVLMVFCDFGKLRRDRDVVVPSALRMIWGLLRRQGPVNWARRCSVMVEIRDCGGDCVANDERLGGY